MFTFTLFIGAGCGECRGECSVGRNAFNKNQNWELWQSLHAALPDETRVVAQRHACCLPTTHVSLANKK